MTAFFSTAFITALSASPGMINGSVVKCVLFREAPNFEPNDSRYISKTTVAQLLAMPGWIPVTAGGPPLGNTITVGVRDEGKSNYVVFSSFPFTGLAKSEVKAVAFLRPDNTLMFVTNTPFGGEMRVVANGDAVTASPDSTLGAVSNRWMFNWADAPQAGGTIVTISEGPLLLSLGAPTFEPSHTQHVWLYPQRANMIANPSFELASPPTGYWTTNGSATRIPLVNPPIAAGRFAGRFQYGGIVVAESNTFPTNRQERWTIQLMARGLGECKVGFVWWDDDFEEAAVDWGNETWPLDPNTFIHIAVCRTPVQTYQGMLRIESSGGDLTIDQVLCEAGYLKDWAYFDGDTDYGMREDFTWYGGEVRQGASYSLWYNHKKAVYGRMFARQIDGTTLITDEVMREQGIVYEWVPAGTVVVPHMDVLYPNDLQLVVPDKVGVLSYRANAADLQGIVNPWGIVVDAGLHAHSASHVTLQVFLQVQSATHAHTAANVVTVAVPNTAMAPANAAHAQTAANVTLTYIESARGDNATHAVTSTDVVLSVQQGPPFPVRTGMVAWWDADDGTSFQYNGGNIVYRWLDKAGAVTGTTRALANPASNLDPVRSGTQNGKPTVVFDGNNHYLYTNSFTLPQPFTVFVACTWQPYSFWGGPLEAIGETWSIYNGPGSIGKVIAGGTEQDFNPDLGGTHIWTFVFNGATSFCRKDGVDDGRTYNPGTGGTTTGVRTGFNNVFWGSLFEMAIFSRVLTAQEITDVNGYLNTKWAVF